VFGGVTDVKGKQQFLNDLYILDLKTFVWSFPSVSGYFLFDINYYFRCNTSWAWIS
jgi:hypothetical protein